MSRSNMRRQIVLSLVILAGFLGWQLASRDTAMANDPTAHILSPDFTTADRALAEAIKDRNAALVERALEQKHLELKLKAATALATMGERTSIPRLIEALERNQAKITGGSEATILQTDLNRAIVAALSKLTTIDYGTVDPASEQDVARALRLSREWWEKNKN
jgi:hypothetical protein